MARLILRDANVVDGEHPPRGAQTVVVDGERIAAVGPDASIESAPGDRVVDLAGRTVMPGLSSCHFHTTFEGVSPISAPSLGLQSPPAYLALLAAKNVGIALDCGVTSIVCSSTAYAIDASLRQAIEEGWVRGPRMAAGSNELMSSGDVPSGSSRNFYMQLGNKGLVRTADGADGFTRAVRDEIKKGAEIVKLSMSQGHNAGPTEERVSLSPAELDAAVRASHARGAKVRAHAVSKASILECARAGVDIIDHADRVDDECVEAILAAGSTVVPSLLYGSRVLECFDAGLMGPFLPDPIPPIVSDVMESMREDGENMARMLPVLAEAGVHLVVGDDYGTAFLPHGDYARELEFYVKQVGIAPLEVLRWATREGAQLLGMGDETGTVEAGKLADLLVIDGDPLVDIGCLAEPRKRLAILLGGAFVKDELAA